MAHQTIHGIHAVEAALKATPEKIKQLYVQQSRHDERIDRLVALAKAAKISVQQLSREALDTLLTNTHHQGVAAEITASQVYTESDLFELLDGLSHPPFLLVLDGVQDPHNLGACLRTANAAGVHAVIAPKDRAVSITPVVRKVASGAAEFIPFVQVTNLVRTLKALQQRNIWVYGASEAATTAFYDVDLKGPLALVIGAEGKGLRRLTSEVCDLLINIPTVGYIASLNVSVATGVCLFEAVRQRNLAID